MSNSSNPLCCASPTKMIFVWDSPNAGYAYNLYACEGCGKLHKQDVWTNKGTLTLDIKNVVVQTNN